MRIVRYGRWAATLLLLPLLCLGGTRVGAAPACPKRPASKAVAKSLASKYWRKAVKHYDKGRNVQAIAAWQCAYHLAPHPLALYNIGRSAVLAGKVALAVKSYEEYLRLMPTAANRAEVEATLRGLRARLPRRVPPVRRVTPPVRRVTPPVRRVTPPVRRVTPPVRRVTPPVRRVTPPVRRVTPPVRRVTPPVGRAGVTPETPTDPAPAKPGRTLRIAGWSVLGVGVGAAILAGVMGGLTKRNKGWVEDAEPGTPYEEVKYDVQDAKLYNTLTWVFAGVGAAAMATGAALLVLGYKNRGEKAVTVTPTVLRGGAAVTFGGSF